MVHKNAREIADSIIDRIVSENPIISRDDFKADGLLSIVIEAISIAMEELYAGGDGIEANNVISKANKSYLDLIGNAIGLFRGSKDDDSFRYDIVNWFSNSRTSSRNAVQKAIEDTEGVYTYSIENLAYGAGTFAVHLQTQDNVDTDRVVSNLSSTLSDVVAEGVYFNIITPKDVDIEISLSVVGDTSGQTMNALKSAIRGYITSVKAGSTLYINRIESAAINSSPNITSAFLNYVKINGRTLYSNQAKLLTDEQFRISDANIIIE